MPATTVSARPAGLRLAAHRRLPANTMATVTLTIGIVKPPAELVTWPTTHIEKAPTSEPNALNVPAAVETWALETS